MQPGNNDAATLHDHLRRAAGDDGVLSFAAFMEIALYAPEGGYYTARRDRVGHREGTDFYTAASIQPLYGQLVAAACANLLGGQAGATTFLEIGPEQPGGVLAEEDEPPFAATETRTRDDERPWPRPCVLFANEVLDAQPFHRLVFHEGQWRERGVRVHGPGDYREVLLARLSEAVAEHAEALPATAPEGWQLDWPLGAESLVASWAQRPEPVLMVLPDYGLAWETLLYERPAGTARAYCQHRQEAALLAAPGQQDLTCHLAWDRLEAVLRAHGWETRVERQEAFFLHHAAAVLTAGAADAGAAGQRVRHQMRELLHPEHLGHRFQVLTAWRSGPN